MQTADKRIAYGCKTCRGVSIRAEHVAPLLYEIVGGRLAMPDAVDLLKAEIHDAVQAEAIRLELETLYAELEKIGIERGQRLLTGQQAKTATDLINTDIAKLERRQQDQERLRVFKDIALGTPKAVDAIRELSPDRFRAVLRVLASITVAPVGKGGHLAVICMTPNVTPAPSATLPTAAATVRITSPRRGCFGGVSSLSDHAVGASLTDTRSTSSVSAPPPDSETVV
jgi:hypothetical protein